MGMTGHEVQWAILGHKTYALVDLDQYRLRREKTSASCAWAFGTVTLEVLSLAEVEYVI